MSRALPAVHRLAPRVFYGWFVAVGASVLAFVSVGIGFYGIGVFLDALCGARGWSRASVSGATSLYFVVSGLAGTVIGRSVDRHGARGWILFGCALMAGSLLALGQVTAPWQLYLVYPGLALGFAMCGGVPSQAMVTRWFVAKRARALSFAQTGVSLGGVVLVPLTVGLVESRGLETAAGTLAALLLAVAVPVTLLVLRFDPEPFGLAPDGPGAAPPVNPLLAPERQLRRWTTREVLATLSFWRLAAGFALVLFAQQAVLMHEVAYLRERLDAGAAALAVSTTAGGSIVARLAVGGVADRLEKRRLAVALILFQAATLVGFTLAPGPASLFACALALGFTIGNLFMMQSLLAGELFGLASFGRVFGTLLLVSQVAGGFGPFALGLLFERWGGYEVPFRVLAGLDVVAAGILVGLRAPRGS